MHQVFGQLVASLIQDARIGRLLPCAWLDKLLQRAEIGGVCVFPGLSDVCQLEGSSIRQS